MESIIPPFFIGDDPSDLSINLSEMEERLLNALFDRPESPFTLYDFIQDFALSIIHENADKIRDIAQKEILPLETNTSEVLQILAEVLKMEYRIPKKKRDFGK